MDNREHTSYCYYCFEPLDAQGICPECGKDSNAPVSPNHLLPGTRLRGRFMVGRALGQDASGIVYVALDVQTDSFLRVREYFPRGLCEREPDGTVRVLPESTPAFEQGLDGMEASTVTQDGTRRRIFFEANGTGYLVQRKVPDPLPDPEELAASQFTRNLFILGAVVCVILIGTMIALLNMGKNALDATRNATLPQGGDYWEAPTTVPTETIRPEEIIPAERPLPTPLNTMGDEADEPGRYDGETLAPDDLDGEFADFDSDEYIDPEVAPEPTPVRNYKKASPEQIALLQERLMELAWLDYDEPTGKYDPPTRQAILEFQKYVNKEYRAGLTADSDCGPQTSDWLFDVDAPSKPLPTLKPTKRPTPTPKPTKAPTPTPKPTATPSPTPKPTPTAPPPTPSPDPTEAPTEPPATEAPVVTEPPATEPPVVTEPPATEPPAAPEQPAEAETKGAVDTSDPVDSQALNMLLQLSWLDVPEDQDGLSKAAYTEALRAFQQAANDELGLDLNEQGKLDQATMACLMSADAPINGAMG